MTAITRLELSTALLALGLTAACNKPAEPPAPPPPPVAVAAPQPAPQPPPPPPAPLEPKPAKYFCDDADRYLKAAATYVADLKAMQDRFKAENGRLRAAGNNGPVGIMKNLSALNEAATAKQAEIEAMRKEVEDLAVGPSDSLTRKKIASTLRAEAGVAGLIVKAASNLKIEGLVPVFNRLPEFTSVVTSEIKGVKSACKEINAGK